MSLSRNFSYCSWGFQGKNTEVVCHSLLQWTTFCQTSPPWPTRLGWPHRAWLSLTELDKAVVLVWLEWLVFCEYGFSVSALWCLLATPTILLGFHTTFSIFSLRTHTHKIYITTNPQLRKGQSVLILVDSFLNLKKAQTEKRKKD